MLVKKVSVSTVTSSVSVAGCLGYDVLASKQLALSPVNIVSVAGCLGYDVLDN